MESGALSQQQGPGAEPAVRGLSKPYVYIFVKSFNMMTRHCTVMLLQWINIRQVVYLMAVK